MVIAGKRSKEWLVLKWGTGMFYFIFLYNILFGVIVLGKCNGFGRNPSNVEKVIITYSLTFFDLSTYFFPPKLLGVLTYGLKQLHFYLFISRRPYVWKTPNLSCLKHLLSSFYTCFNLLRQLKQRFPEILLE